MTYNDLPDPRPRSRHLHSDNEEYFKYTGPARLNKAIHTLCGLIQGLMIDGEVSASDLRILSSWVYEHQEFVDRHPFNEIIPVLHRALEDRHLSEDEQMDLLWLCQKLSDSDTYYESTTRHMQQLHGIMAGVSFDGVITEAELDGISKWMETHESLRSLWPYDELEALILAVMKDGRIDPDEHKELLAFFADFAKTTGHASISLKEHDLQTVTGVCAVDPQIEFPDKLFCFTGKSTRTSRRELGDLVTSKRGVFKDNVVKNLDYLIVGADGNVCWAYACYGRKIEEVIGHRKNGSHTLLVHENDFWDFV